MLHLYCFFYIRLKEIGLSHEKHLVFFFNYGISLLSWKEASTIGFQVWVLLNYLCHEVFLRHANGPLARYLEITWAAWEGDFNWKGYSSCIIDSLVSELTEVNWLSLYVNIWVAVIQNCQTWLGSISSSHSLSPVHVTFFNILRNYCS